MMDKVPAGVVSSAPENGWASRAAEARQVKKRVVSVCKICYDFTGKTLVGIPAGARTAHAAAYGPRYLSVPTSASRAINMREQMKTLNLPLQCCGRENRLRLNVSRVFDQAGMPHRCAGASFCVFGISEALYEHANFAAKGKRSYQRYLVNCGSYKFLVCLFAFSVAYCVRHCFTLAKLFGVAVRFRKEISYA